MSEESRTEEVAFAIEYVNNPDLLVGTEEVSQVGVNGVRTIVEEVTTVGGEVSRVEVSSEVTKDPVNRIIQVGTKVREEPVDPGESNNTDAANVTVEPKDQDLPPTGEASTTITSVLGALALSIGSALGFRKKRK